jgi:hypothetical protein
VRLNDCYPETPSLALRALNQIKHSADSFAAASGLRAEAVQALIDGSDVDHQEVLVAMGRHPAVDLSTVIPATAAAKLGFGPTVARPYVVMRAADTERSGRVFERGYPPAQRLPYYRYFDTAVQHQSPFRPELIEELLDHEGNDELDVSYFNNGHFESQMTVYLGEANLYWMDATSRVHTFRARRYSATYKLPLVRHTFTARSPGAKILAVTYLGPVAFSALRTRMSPPTVPRGVEGQSPVIESLNEHVDGCHGAGLLTLLPPISTQPSTHAYLARVDQDQSRCLDRLDVDRWLYHAGGARVGCSIGDDSVLIDKGDSICIAPGQMLRLNAGEPAEVVCFEVRSGEGDAEAELSEILRVAGREGYERLTREDRRWFS